MHVITRICVLFLWIHTLSLVKCQDCALQQFLNGNLYDSNFDTSDLEASYPNGAQVRVGCKVGYSGFFKLICDGRIWKHKGNVCQPKPCGHPGDAQFSDFHLEDGDDFVFGSRVVYTCHKGYQMVSRTTSRNCMAKGWDGVVPVCEAKSCPVVHVDNNVQANGDPEEATYGNVLRFSCKSNAEILNGPIEIFCDENGDWSDKAPKCEVVRCTRPEIENGFVSEDIQQYNEHEVLHFGCNRRYKPAEVRLSKCTKLGIRAEWSPTPLCEQITCKLQLTAPGTRYQPAYKNVFLPDETVTVTCDRKFWTFNVKTTSETATCQDDGKWTFTPECKEVTCINPREDQAEIGRRESWSKKMDETTNYSCKRGYRKTAEWATCTRDGWTPSPLCEAKTCDRKDVQYADIDGTPQSKYGYNEQVKYICKNGYVGRFILTCEETGWTGSSQCSTCPKAEVPHGFVVGPYNDRLYYTCHEEYKLFTKGWWSEAKCNGTAWPELERCIEKTNCGEFPVIRNGEVTHQHHDSGHGYEQGARVKVKCDKGYKTEDDVLTCDGKWKSVIPFEEICTPTATPCQPPPKVENATVVNLYHKEYLSDSEVIYQCRHEYTIEGEDKIRCNDGKWEEKNIICTSVREIMLCTPRYQMVSRDDTRTRLLDKRTNHLPICDHKSLRGLNMDSRVICKVHICTTESTLTGCIIAWYGNYSALNRKALQRVVKTAQHITRTKLQPMEDLCAQWCRKKANRIIRHPHHPTHKRFFAAALQQTVPHHQAQGQLHPCLLVVGHHIDGDLKSTRKTQYNPSESVEYMCERYYTMEGQPFRTCINGEWTGQLRCLKPCVVNEDDFRQHSISKSSGNEYLSHDEIIEFRCARGIPVGAVAMRQRCNGGVLLLPTCQ
ncbi:complement factor H-like [Enoplosus armatus]|uniref:complement factor H-like n=1 Tax=Enoplosus armatus TaxID=215367 RepID=UPI00399398DE